MKTRLIILLCFITGIANAQKIAGVVYDKTSGSTIPYATVALYDNEGALITGTTSAGDGSFAVNFGRRRGEVKLVVMFVGFKSFDRKINLASTDVDAGKIELEPETEQLDAATVTGIGQRVSARGDTTEINAASYKVNPDATAQDLVAKMPGISVQGGTVQAQGEDVRRVTLDGREYFGTDVNAALSNLPAEMIDRVQIIDEQSDLARFTGFNDGNTTKALNILTKTGVNKTTIARITAGYGTDNRYRAGGSLNAVNGDRRISILAQSNNVNEQNFSISDLVGAMGMGGGRVLIGGQGGGGGQRGPGGGLGGMFVPNVSGVTKTNAVGLNYSDTWFDKIKFSGSYFFNRGDNNNDQYTDRFYIDPESKMFNYNEKLNNASASLNTNHRFNFRIEYQIDSSDILMLTPRLTLQTNDGRSVEARDLYNLSAIAETRSNNDYISELTGINFSNSLLYRHRIDSKGRSVTLSLDNTYNKNKGTGKQDVLVEYFEIMPDSILDLRTDMTQNGWSISPGVSYTEPLGKKSMLMADYKYSYTFNSSDKQAFEFNDELNGYRFNSPLSNVFESKYVTNTAGLSYMYNNQNLQFNARVNYQNSNLRNDQTFPSPAGIDQSFDAVVPSLRLMYRFSRNKNLMLAYRAQASSPTISQLQNVLDNSNGTSLKTGNPFLKQNYQHNLFGRYVATGEKGTSFFVMGAIMLSDNYIGNNTVVADNDMTVTVGDNNYFVPRFSQLTSPQNMAGYLQFFSFGTYSFPVKVISSNLSINAAASYRQLPAIINDVKSYSYQPSFSGGITLSSNISQNLDFTLGNNTGYNIVRNSANDAGDNNYLTVQTSFRINWIFLKHLVLQTDVTNNIYSPKGGVNSQNYFLWNAGLGYKLLKNNAAEFRLSVFDILGQNRSYSRNSNSLYIEDVTNKALTRYFMLSFTYNLRRFNGKSQEPTTTEQPVIRMMGPGPGGPGGPGGIRPF